MERLRHRTSRRSELGFTLPEVMIVLILMGILFAIATSTWFSVIESRRVDSAANQLASDLRLAHTTATNRLREWRVEIDPGTPNYRIGPSGGALAARSLPERTEFVTGVTAIAFQPAGGAQTTGSGDITVAADGGDPSLVIEVNPVTSRVRVVG